MSVLRTKTRRVFHALRQAANELQVNMAFGQLTSGQFKTKVLADAPPLRRTRDKTFQRRTIEIQINSCNTR